MNCSPVGDVVSGMITHDPYPSDVSDPEWEFVLPYLCLLPEGAGQRVPNLRDAFDALRWPVRCGAPWRYLPKDLPPWEMVSQQTRRWLAAGCFEAIVHDLRAILRFAAGRGPEPTAAVLDGRTIPSTPESGGRAGYDGYVRSVGGKFRDIASEMCGKGDIMSLLTIALGDRGSETAGRRFQDSLVLGNSRY
jgi:transposase